MKIGVAGIGKVARDNYLPYLGKLPGVELGLWSRDRRKAEAEAARWKAEVVDTPEQLGAWGADVVFVLTSEHARHEVGHALLRGGARRLFLEKPLVAVRGQAHVSEEDFALGRELLRAARVAGCETAMVFNYRFFKQTERARRIIRERGFGALTSATGVVHYACWSHCIDLVLHFGGAASSLSAVEAPVVRSSMGIEARDVSVAFTLAGGAGGTLLGTCALAWQHALFELVLVFERGRVHLRGIDGPLEVLDASGSVEEVYTLTRDASQWVHYGASFEASLAAYLASLERGEEPPVPGLAGLLELQFEAALRRSVREGRRVEVAAEFPVP